MRILVSNDDGIYSPGIAALARVAEGFGDVCVVAPDVERSSAGHSITSSLPLRYRTTDLAIDVEAYRVNGTPADCVALGIHRWGEVDIVLSGINIGTNLGNAIWHSGTLAAAKQAVLQGIPGIALSTPADPVPDFESLLSHVEAVLRILLSRSEIPLVNVNLPPRPRGIRWARQAVERYHGEVVPGRDPHGRELYWFSVRRLENSLEGTDRWALDHDFIALTPLRLDLTDHVALERLQAVDAPPAKDAVDSAPAPRATT